MGDYHPSPNGMLPPGSKLWLLNLGILDVDNAVVVAGMNSFAATDKETKHTRRDLVMISVMIDYPGVGLILYDTGSPEDVIQNWTHRDLECTPRIWDKSTNGLPEAIKATGNDIKDVKVVIMSHLHMDHAGGLEHFMGTGSCCFLLRLGCQLRMLIG
jgi:glyoxylase-like metal-dependent hydrolase (beta-lactamase superfamily II)